MTSPITKSLEEDFYSFATEIDLSKKCKFHDFLSPTEHNIKDVKPHLLMKSPGFLLSTGHERSLFDLLLSDENCQGLVIVDINPKIKAYIDFLLFLIRISETRDHFIAFSTPITTTEEFQSKIKLLHSAGMGSSLPDRIKEYYLSHLETFGNIYLTEKHLWRKDRRYDVVNYHKNDALFKKLQKYACAGNIIAVVGNIGNISFLNSRNIEIIDESNIGDYTFIQYETSSQPRLITTERLPLHQGDIWAYRSNPRSMIPHRFL